MAILATQRMQSDLEFLQTAKLQKYQTVSTEKIEELKKNKIEYKKQITTLEERDLYSSLKVQLHELCERKLPYRIVEIIKKCLKQGQSLPPSLSQSLKTSDMAIPAQFPSKQERKEALSALKQKLLHLGKSHEEALKIVESLHWMHGTNSAILPLLPHSGYTMLSTGELLDNGLAPMCGELTEGGMRASAVNQQWLSVETVRNLSLGWKYAAQISNSFDPTAFETAESFFINCLRNLMNLSPDDNMWDKYVIKLLQLKQWLPECFDQLQTKHSSYIEEIIQASTKKLLYREAMILEALYYPEDELKKAVHDEPTRKIIENKFPFLTNIGPSVWDDSGVPKLSYFVLEDHFTDLEIISHDEWENIIHNIINMRLFTKEHLCRCQNSTSYSDIRRWQSYLDKYPHIPDLDLYFQKLVKEKVEKRIQAKSCSSAKRLVRLKNVFEKKLPVEIGEEERPLILAPFPLLVGSTKTKCFFLNGNQEANISSAKWGEEVDVVFVRGENLPEMAAWLKQHDLQDKIRLYRWETISSLASFPLYHSSGDAIGENHALSQSDYLFIHQQIQSLLPLYQKPFPDGSFREYHGTLHATRAALFSAIIAEMHLAQGHLPTAEPKHLPITGFIHDAGRESDYGTDLWDAQSGEICREFMANQLHLSPDETELLSKSISEKDVNPPTSLEQKILHDADCIEIIRCFLSNPDAFDPEKLWMFRDNFPKPLLDLFIHEAKGLITLTEKPLIKKFIQTSPDPLRCLMQIIQFANCFSFLRANSFNALSLCLPSDYLLTPEVEEAINEYLKEKK